MHPLSRMGRRKFLCDSLGLGAAPLLSGVSSSEPARAEQVPTLPVEHGGSPDVPYDGYERFPEYVTPRDGTKLAIDCYRPTKRGMLHTEKLPVVWPQDRYLRALIANGRVYNHLDESPKLFVLLTHEYVISTADVRGLGASFGVTDGWLSPKEAEDSYDITEWLAAQPAFCSSLIKKNVEQRIRSNPATGVCSSGHLWGG
ncbi:MAG: CocE/NonD family hydrolase [Terriglobia bacterium]